MLKDIDKTQQVFHTGALHDKVTFDDVPYAAQHRPVWVPTPWESVRPGADDHLKHLSRRGDTMVEHRGPIAMTGILKDNVDRGRA